MGVALALDAPSCGCLLSPVELREVIDTANSSAIGACLDLGKIAALGSPADWVTTLGHRVHAVRVSHEQAPRAPLDSDDLPTALQSVPRDRPIIVHSFQPSPWLRVMGVADSSNRR